MSLCFLFSRSSTTLKVSSQFIDLIRFFKTKNWFYLFLCQLFLENCPFHLIIKFNALKLYTVFIISTFFLSCLSIISLVFCSRLVNFSANLSLLKSFIDQIYFVITLYFILLIKRIKNFYLTFTKSTFISILDLFYCSPITNFLI